jgi:hypothetical protein
MATVFLAEARALRKFGVDKNMRAVEPVGHDVLAPHCAIIGTLVAIVVASPAFSFSFVAAMRVIVISSGNIGSAELAKVTCTGPRTCPALIPVLITAPKARTSKKLSHMNFVRALDSSSFCGFSLAGQTLPVRRAPAPPSPCSHARSWRDSAML